MTAYTKDYQRGWRYSQTASANLDTADRRGWSKIKGWMDGYLDNAAGRPKWHLRECSNHSNVPGGCGQA